MTALVTPLHDHAASLSSGSRSSYRTVSPEGAGFCRENSTSFWAVERLHPFSGWFLIRESVDTGMPVPLWITASPPIASAYCPSLMEPQNTENGTPVNGIPYRVAWSPYFGTIPPGESP